MIPSDSIGIRPYRPEDKNFVYSTWLNNFKHSSYFAKRIKPSIFFKGHQAVIDTLFLKSQFKVFIAHPRGDEDTILGYIACEPNEPTVVHFTFVKDAFRRMGVAGALYKHTGVNWDKMIFTHWTYPVDEMIRKNPEMTYNPYMF